jgi:hypothetical protein
MEKGSVVLDEAQGKSANGNFRIKLSAQVDKVTATVTPLQEVYSAHPHPRYQSPF